MYRENAVQTLTVVPVTDGNYKCALEDATEGQLQEAIEKMKGTTRNKSRITACERELRERMKGKKRKKWNPDDGISGAEWRDFLNSRFNRMG